MPNDRQATVAIAARHMCIHGNAVGRGWRGLVKRAADKPHPAFRQFFDWGIDPVDSGRGVAGLVFIGK